MPSDQPEELYLVSYSWYEDYSPTLVRGPAVPDWEELCRGLLAESAERALAERPDTWCGWDGIKRGLVAELEERGYSVVQPPEFSAWGSIIIEDEADAKGLPPEAAAKVLAHNARVRQEQDDRLHRRTGHAE